MDKFVCYMLHFVVDAEARLDVQESSSGGGSKGGNEDEHGVKGDDKDNNNDNDDCYSNSGRPTYANGSGTQSTWTSLTATCCAL